MLSNMIKFCFDKNVWSNITNMTEENLEHFKKLIQRPEIGIYYSPIGVMELVKGMQLESNFESCQKEVRLVYATTNRHILEDPRDHVGRTAHHFLGKPFKEPDNTYLKLCREIAISNSYNELKRKVDVDKLSSILVNFENEWAEEVNNIGHKFRKDDLDKDTKEQYRSNAFVLRKRKETLWGSFCKHYFLPQEACSLNLDEAISGLHGFRYWVDYRIAYENKVFFDNKKSRSSDYLDWQQTIYLDIMDYIVTEDKKLITIFRESKNDELKKASLRFDEFCNRLEQNKLPSRRAPNSTSEIWRDAT